MQGSSVAADKRSVLLVEDDNFLRDIFSRKLSDTFDLTSTASGKEALEIVKEKKPILVLLDLNLPDENGFDVLREIRENEELKDTLVLILTNSVLSEDITKSNELKADDFITKADFSMDDIINRIEKHIQSRVLSK